MGLTYAPFGIFGGIMLTVVPQLLAAAHVPEPQIAGVTATAMIPGFIAFLLSPLLDWRFRRRTYAVFFAGLMLLCLVGALLSLGDLPRLTGLLFAGYLSAQLYAIAIGGRFGALVATEQIPAI
jgi:MFS transporter, PAT family, beta-lactamase induction signal transducer AmpG